MRNAIPSSFAISLLDWPEERDWVRLVAWSRCAISALSFEQLNADVERTRIAYSEASCVYQALLEDIPSGWPSPDGSFRLKQASEHFRQALRAYTRAVRRLDDFVRSGGKGG